MYKKCYEMLDSLSQYDKDNRKYQEVLSNKRVELEETKRKAKIEVPKLIIILVALCIFTLHKIAYFDNAFYTSNFLFDLYYNFNNAIKVFILNLLLTGIAGIIILIIVIKLVVILTFGCKKLFDSRDSEYINKVLKKETHTLHKTDFRYINSHEIAVNFHGKDHIFDTDIINVDDNCKSINIQSSLQVVKGKLKTVVEYSNGKEAPDVQKIL